MKYHVSFDIDFRRNPYKGRYIAVEGIDGSGKSTQAEKLKEYFEEKRKKVLLTHEPTRKPPIGDLIHNVIQGNIKLPASSFQYLFAADREVHSKTTIEPFLEQGKIIITDRCFWSSVAYGILDKSDKLNGSEILLVAQSILSMYHQFIIPDFTFYIKISEEAAVKRLAKMDKKQEYYETLEKLKKIKEGYDWLAKKFSNEIITINGEQSVEKVTADIIKIYDLRFKN
ncbi:MAG: dTMP kinase [Candidatus Levybacteria bacterium]|nr:dTMP kinase [Candidatus Levybacteria bacterium]